ncbi:hypothetical protein [Pendulispora albinea]|uniref:Uncharacterized protein n=1 Tax=Pendulispora albinea TaxID=2741071 RepID=A0ABZ2LLT3_9BACT
MLHFTPCASSAVSPRPSQPGRMGRRTLLSVAIFTSFASLAHMAAGCGKSEPPKPGQPEFDTANAKIDTFSGEVGFGADAEAVALARKFSTTLKKLEAESFTGGKDETRDTFTKGNWLTYAHVRPTDIVFLVQAPNLDTYKKGEDRKALIELAFEAAQTVTENLRAARDRKLVVAIRGKVFYGGFATGAGNGKPKITQDTSLDVAWMYPAFAPPGAAGAASGAPAAK